MIIRTFKTADLEVILQLFYEVVHTTGAKYYDKEQVEAWAPKNGLDKKAWLETLSSHLTYVADEDNKIVGFGDMTTTGYIDHLYILKNYQGRGIARALLKKLEEEAHRLGLKELTLESSIMAMPLAKRQGYEVINEQRKMLRGKEFITYKMRKTL
jgi:putative acetyltransferase